MTERVLDRQLRRAGLARDRLPELQPWQEFIERVASTYAGYEQDRYLLERSTTLAGAEMRKLHHALRRDRERLRAVIDALDVGLVVLASGFTVELANPEAGRILGVPVPQLHDWTLHDLQVCGKDDQQLWQLLRDLGRHDGVPSVRGAVPDARLCSADGCVVPVSVSVVPVEHLGTAMGAVIVLRDLSELHQLEMQLRQAQKLEAVGRLASGVAHELNTPIQFVGDNLRFLRDSVRDLLAAVDPAAAVGYVAEDLPEAIAQSLEGIERVSSIVAAMKSFSHPGETRPAPADVNQAVRDTVIVAGNEVKGVADVVLELGNLPSVECLIHDLKQVFLNLLINAAHAIADRRKAGGGEGLITIRTRQEGDDVVIGVTDDGCGMSDEIAEHVFEPFFTTKDVGRGTGQGLTLAHAIVVEGHRGSISLESLPGQGTTFTIRIPLRVPRRATCPASDDLLTAGAPPLRPAR